MNFEIMVPKRKILSTSKENKKVPTVLNKELSFSLNSLAIRYSQEHL